MRVIGTLCTVPWRAEGLRRILSRLLEEQSRPIDELELSLNGYQDVPEDLKGRPRLRLFLRPGNPGPWVRYEAASRCDEGDVLLTLDDDVDYPVDYVERGLAALTAAGPGAAVCFGGFVWSATLTRQDYGEARLAIELADHVGTPVRIAVLKGATGLFRALDVRGVHPVAYDGLRTNDDLMVSAHLQQNGRRLLCWPKPESWIVEQDAGRERTALWRSDASVRRRTFQWLVRDNGFDPTAGRREEACGAARRLLVVIGDERKVPLEEIEKTMLDRLEGADFSAAVTVVEESLRKEMERGTELPFDICWGLVPGSAGRLDFIQPVRAWRRGRVRRAFRRRLRDLCEDAHETLKPTEIIWVGESAPCWRPPSTGTPMELRRAS